MITLPSPYMQVLISYRIKTIFLLFYLHNIQDGVLQFDSMKTFPPASNRRVHIQTRHNRQYKYKYIYYVLQC